ncbi:MAG TPA: N-acetylmuramoyl-L-alanine amidase, partial [Candidatus Acidoferrum sp.]|nr:N-acetylmuramoyl-L-alanine amidase [Candidatus Acidoferrum sp.]
VRSLSGSFYSNRRILSVAISAAAVVTASLVSTQAQQPAVSATQQPGAPIQTPPYPTVAPPPFQRTVLNMVVLDPAHGGTDPGARGAQGIRESDLVIELTFLVRRALEATGFQVLQTRNGNENPSFDDRSTLANAQRGAVFVTLHISSTGLPGTVRVYSLPDMPSRASVGGILSWDFAQASYVTLSRKFGDAVQAQLAQRFKGSPSNVQAASVRQLRTTAAPAIAVELSSVSVQDRGDLDKMMPGVADAIARGLTAFRPSYVLPSEAGARP